MGSEKLRPMAAEDLELVLGWRNHQNVRKFMYTTHEIGFEEHQKWFVEVGQNPKTELLIFEKDGIPCGFINITRTRCREIADWGFYVAPEAPKGTGRLLGKITLNYAFNELKLHKICGQALCFNERSIVFHKALGFKEEGRLRDQHFDGKNYHDIICFGLIANEWISHQQD